MAIQTQNFQTLVSNSVAAIQGAAKSLVDLSIGSILRSLVEANAAIALWLQGIALQIAALTRFATSNLADADSWAADFGFTRLLAVPATGQVTFSRFTATNQASIPLGTIVQTADGTQTFSVIADTTQSAYNALTSAYIIPVGVTSAVATVQAAGAAAAGNVSAGAISLLGQALAYVDTVSNAAAFINGADAESDPAFRARFIAYIASLSRATRTAVGYAITSLKLGMNYTLTENLTYGGVVQLGYFYVVVDDGTGAPSSILLASVSNAIDAVRPIGSSFGVFAPAILTANISMTVTTDPAYAHAGIVALVSAAITAYINTLPIGTSLPYTRLSQIAYDTSPGVTNVTAALLNGGTTDLVASAQQVLKMGVLLVA